MQKLQFIHKVKFVNGDRSKTTKIVKGIIA